MCERVCRKCFEETLVALGDRILPLDVFEIILDSQMLIFNKHKNEKKPTHFTCSNVPHDVLSELDPSN